MPEPATVVVVGAGQAGLSVSHELGRVGVDHVVLERGRVAQRWRDRWESFCLVVLCTGAYQRAHRAPIAGALPEDVAMLDTPGYTAPGDLPPGPVLVVGSGRVGEDAALVADGIAAAA